MTYQPIAALFAVGTLFAQAQQLTPEFDAAEIHFSQTGSMDLDDGPGKLDVTRLELEGFLSKPISFADGWVWIPKAAYSFTALNTSDVAANYPIDDDELHSLRLSSMILSTREGSPWVFGGWARAELASDFQKIDTDDFTFDLAAGGGYRFNDQLTFGIGAAVINLNGNPEAYPGIFLDWQAAEHLRVSIYGPNLSAKCTAIENWEFALRGDPAGGVWNVTDDNGKSRSIDFSSYRVGFYASRHLGGQRWITAGCGMVLGNELDYTKPQGRTISSRDADSTFFGSVGLRIVAW